MFCTSCGTQTAEGGVFCAKCGKPVAAGTAANPAADQQFGGPMKQPMMSPRLDSDIPEGVKGWSWGAFLLSWIWALGNRTWIGLLALVPYIGFFVAIWLGVKGREMAWKNAEWDSVEHFNRVQRRWSVWAVILIFGVAGLGIVAAIAIPAYQDYTVRSRQMQMDSVQIQQPAPIVRRG